MKHGTYICYAKRTPIGKLSGHLSCLSAPSLGAKLVEDCLKVYPHLGAHVQEIIMGQVLTAGQGQAPARQTALLGGLKSQVCATTVNRVCGSGLKAVILGDQSIRLGESSLVLAGGQESMSQAPHLLPRSRLGYRFGGFSVLDHMEYDGLTDAYQKIPMGVCAEACAKEYGWTRPQQDQYAIQSYEKARKAIEQGFFKEEILPIGIKNKKGEDIISQDEEPFSVELSKIPSLKPAFDPQGTITAANASSINDGAALLLLADEPTMKKHGLVPIAKILASASFAHEPLWFSTAPVPCIQQLVAKAHISISDVDLFEINEAFALVVMTAIKDLGLNPDRVNISGGAVALGHPIGASGARVIVTLIHGLKRLKKRLGVAALCIGGGEASAVLVEACL